MQLDATTLNDLSIINVGNALFTLLDHCHTKEGSLLLKDNLQYPFNSLEAINQYHHAIRYWNAHRKDFKWGITNGTVIMLQQFLNSNEFRDKQSNDLALKVNTFFKKIVQKESIENIIFLTEQSIALFKDAKMILDILFSTETIPDFFIPIKAELEKALEQPAIRVYTERSEQYGIPKKIAMIHDLKRYAGKFLEKIIYVIAQIDVLNVMTDWSQKEGWSIPIMHPSEALTLKAEVMFHPLLTQAQPYDITFDSDNQFLLLTGANMSGKSTFMRTIGLCASLAHCGFPVPARYFETSYFNALISQIQVQDDISKGESYFYAEVLRIKQTAQRINQQSHNLIILDELFKGTNVHDAYDCSVAVVKGLLKKGNNLILLSTHLHELYKHLEDSQGLFFKYFETLIDEQKNFRFTYQLKDGVSKDRIGYALLKQEGVIDLLN